METKVCTKCGEEKPATAEWFYRNNCCKDGLNTQCMVCQKKQQKEYRDFNKDKIKNKNQSYRNNSSELCKRLNKKYRNENKEYCAEYQKKYCKANRDKRIQYAQNRKSRKNSLVYSLKSKDWESAKTFFACKCAYCGNNTKLAQDHFFPLSRGGEYTKFNIIPACKSCNSSKNNKQFEEWYPTHESYSPEREAKIYRYFEQLALENGGWGRQRYDLGTVTVEVINEDL